MTIRRVNRTGNDETYDPASHSRVTSLEPPTTLTKAAAKSKGKGRVDASSAWPRRLVPVFPPKP